MDAQVGFSVAPVPGRESLLRSGFGEPLSTASMRASSTSACTGLKPRGVASTARGSVAFMVPLFSPRSPPRHDDFGPGTRRRVPPIAPRRGGKIQCRRFPCEAGVTKSGRGAIGASVWVFHRGSLGQENWQQQTDQDRSLSAPESICSKLAYGPCPAAYFRQNI